MAKTVTGWCRALLNGTGKIRPEGQPVRYDTLNGQIELWPVPDRAGYGLLVEYIAGKPRFSQDTDRPRCA